MTVVDDSSDFLELVRLILEPQGYVLTCISRGASVESLVDSRPDLLVIDLHLRQPSTELAGWDLVELASHHAELHSTPILVCSADLAHLNERRRDLRDGARVHLLAKPFALDRFEHLVERLTGTGSAAESAPV